MIKREFWEEVSETWIKKEKIYIPPVDEEDVPPDDPVGEMNDEEIPFDDIDDLDGFFQDILNGI